MNSIPVPLILSTTMLNLLGIMNMAHSVLPIGGCFNTRRHQRRMTAQEHNTLLHGSSSPVNHGRPSPEQTLRNSELPASPTRARVRNFSRSKVKFTMTFRLIHTHFTSFGYGCLRKAWYTKFAEVRGGGIENSNTSGSVLIGHIVYGNQSHNATVKYAR